MNGFEIASRLARRLTARLDPRDDAGSALLEVVVSALMIAIVAIGVLGAVDAATRSTADERHRAQAHGIAQDDLSRMRSMRVSDLSNFNQTRTVSRGGSTYTVVSRAEFASDATGTASCEAGTAAADYILITSTVSWPSMGERPPVSARSLVSPPNGSISANSGSLAVRVEDAAGNGFPGISLSGSGPASFNGSTGENGCVVFGNLPAGNYTLNVSTTSLVDKDGNPPQPQSASVVAESTNTMVLQYDHPGTIGVTFGTRVNGELVASSADSVVVLHTGMTTPKVFGTVGQPLAEITALGLFPFPSPYAVFAGTCDGNNPNPSGDEESPNLPAIASVVVPAGNSAPAVIELPALHLTAWSGSDPGTPGSPLAGARVVLADQLCTDENGDPVERGVTTDSEGHLADPGLPFGVYDVCVDDGARHVIANDLAVQDLVTGTTLDVFLGSPEAITGACP